MLAVIFVILWKSLRTELIFSDRVHEREKMMVLDCYGNQQTDLVTAGRHAPKDHNSFCYETWGLYFISPIIYFQSCQQ